MLKKSLLLVLLVFSQIIYADELPDDCEAAVDAADRLNSDSNKHCDYSKTGLNGVLHKAFANKAAASEQATKAVVAEQTPKVAAAVTSNLPRAIAREFDSAQQLNVLRYELLQLAAKDCAAGFVLVEERYLPVADKRLKLELR